MVIHGSEVKIIPFCMLVNYCSYTFLYDNVVNNIQCFLKQGGSLDMFVVNSFGSAFQVHCHRHEICFFVFSILDINNNGCLITWCYAYCRQCSYAFFSPSYQNYGASRLVNYQTILKMALPAFWMLGHCQGVSSCPLFHTVISYRRW